MGLIGWKRSAQGKQKVSDFLRSGVNCKEPGNNNLCSHVMSKRKARAKQSENAEREQQQQHT